MRGVSPFLARAEEILATARQGSGEDCDMAILIGRDGGLQFMPGSGWAIESLRMAHGAAAAYRVTRLRGRVMVEASSGSERCKLEAGGEPGVFLSSLAAYRPSAALPAACLPPVYGVNAVLF